MIVGSVTNLEASIQIEIIGNDGTRHLLRAVADTGYNGHITLSQSFINSLGLTFSGIVRGMLADGSMISMSTYLADVVWLNEIKKIVVTEADGGPLIGMALLEQNRITIDVINGGKVDVQPLV
jgi:clan AA aspartic protease